MSENRELLIKLVLKAVGCDRLRSGEIADHLIANGVTVSNSETVGDKWIPVTERLPEEGGRYLCYVKSFAFKGAFYTTILHYDKYGFAEGNIYTDDVTHWMLMPEPPKGE